MKSKITLSEEAKKIIINALDEDKVKYYVDLDKYVNIMMKCSGADPTNEDLLKFLCFDKPNNNPVKKIFDIYYESMFGQDNNRRKRFLIAYSKVAKFMELELPDDFLDMDVADKWRIMFSFNKSDSRIIKSPVASRYINDKLGAYDIEKGYFVFKVPKNGSDDWDMLVPLDEYNPNDIRQHKLVRVLLQPLNEIDIFDILKFAQEHHNEISELRLNYKYKDLTITNINELSGKRFRDNKSNDFVCVDTDISRIKDRVDKANKLRLQKTVEAMTKPKTGQDKTKREYVDYRKNYHKERNDDD